MDSDGRYAILNIFFMLIHIVNFNILIIFDIIYVP